MGVGWDELSGKIQYFLACAAFEEAVDLIAEQAEIFAERIESGAITDQGGAESLRTLAKLVRFQVRVRGLNDEDSNHARSFIR